MEDRRQYFRINDQLILNCYEITESDLQIRLDEMAAGIERPFNERHPLLGLDVQLKGYIQQYRQVNPEQAYAIELLNTKLDFILKHMNIPDSEMKQLQEERLREVSLSACGISFDYEEAINEGKSVVLELVLVPEYSYMVVYGKVVASEQDDRGLSITFEHIREEDQERLIQHILKKQAGEIQARKRKE